MSNKKVLLKKSNVITNGKAKSPSEEDLDFGELAINYAGTKETFFIKNSDKEIVSLPFRAVDEAKDLLEAHVTNIDNPHSVTKEQIGLGNVDNTSDADKPLSNAEKNAFSYKIQKDDIIDDLTTNNSSKPLSAAQGVVLMNKINEMTHNNASDLTRLENRVTSVEEEISTATSYIDETLDPKARELLSLTV